MGFGRGAVDTLQIRRLQRRQAIENGLPDGRLRPPVKAIVDRGVRPIDLGTITPPAAEFDHMQNAADHLAIATGLHPTAVLRQMRFNCRPLLVRQPKFVATDPLPVTEELESLRDEPDQDLLGSEPSCVVPG